MKIGQALHELSQQSMQEQNLLSKSLSDINSYLKDKLASFEATVYESAESKKLDYEFVQAATRGDIESVKLLLDRKANVSALSNDALHSAASEGHTETVALLLERGADIHSADDWALNTSAWSGQTDTVKLLLDRGANIHAKNDQALKSAAEQDHTDTASLMLVDFNMKVKPETRAFLEEKAPDTFRILEKRDLSEKLTNQLKPKSEKTSRSLKI